MRISISDTNNYLEEVVEVHGWVNSKRDHGKIIFIDIRDATGILQTVICPDTNAYEQAKKIGQEWVISLKGKIKERPKNLKNPQLITGNIEMEVIDIEVLNEAEILPFEIDDTSQIDEDLRLKYRYLDMRTQRMRNNLVLRHDIIKFFREYFWNKDFLEIETPYLTKTTPEGAREYIVPSRLHSGKFYSLSQSPQQFKQLLMVGGIEKYFQIARCFRDEDQRGDRQCEFTQLDIEMSFISEDDIISLIENMMISMVKKIAPEKRIKSVPFPQISYEDAMKKYESDKPDLHEDENELAFVWIVDMPLFLESESKNKLVSAHHPFTMPKENNIDLLDTTPKKVKAQSYDLVLNGFEIAGGSIRIHKREIQNKIFEILGMSKKEIKERFGHILKAFQYGAPPHGGIALGVDRIAAILAAEKTIKEVIAFPKNGDAKDVLVGAPSFISKEQLAETHIKLFDRENSEDSGIDE